MFILLYNYYKIKLQIFFEKERNFQFPIEILEF